MSDTTQIAEEAVAPRTVEQCSVRLLALTAMFAMALALAFVRFESRLFPVYADFSVVETVRIEGGLRLAGLFFKARDCQLVERSFYAADPRDPDTPLHFLSAHFFDQPDAGSVTHAPGSQVWGPWLVNAAHVPSGTNVYMRVTHRCHPFYNTTSRHFVFPAALLDDLDAALPLSPWLPPRPVED